MKKYDILILGAGASGLAAAIEGARTAAENGKKLKIALLEKETVPAKKILATGNGRCNFANRFVSSDCYFGGKDAVRSVFERYTRQDCLDFFDSLGIPAADDGSGRLYPMSRKASSVSSALMMECKRLGVDIITDYPVRSIAENKDIFSVNGEYAGKKLIFAVGSPAGLSKHHSYNGYDLLHMLHINTITPYPCLCGLIADKSYPHSLKGVRNICTVTLFVDGVLVFSEKGEVQFNEKGLSGIPVMQSSCMASHALAKGKKVKIRLDLLPDIEEEKLADRIINRAEKLRGFPAEHLFTGFLPKPLYLFVLKKIGVSASDPLPTEQNILSALAHDMKCTEWTVTDTVGFENAQVAGGGADCRETDKTMQVKKIPGMYLCGEALDVVGLCGGYNLMWAWSSGRLAGRSAAEELLK